MNILICGLPFCGKSTYGSLAAIKMKLPFIDTDRSIESHFTSQTGRQLTCRQIHQELGEDRFRELEEQTIEQLVRRYSNQKRIVFSLGGGSLLSEKNRENLHKLGLIVYLKTPIETLTYRLSKQETMPSYLSSNDPIGDFHKLAEKRLQLYEIASDIIIDTQYMNDSEIIEAICRCPGCACR